uniref:Uncharacterized protein n=1 Tax=Myotis myotis TaxID=51298 RepID=A0A7J7SRG4_MYOMY|nr:hypothetical protein mMyoMyo1_009357 [Myotis myotis]
MVGSRAQPPAPGGASAAVNQGPHRRLCARDCPGERFAESGPRVRMDAVPERHSGCHPVSRVQYPEDRCFLPGRSPGLSFAKSGFLVVGDPERANLWGNQWGNCASPACTRLGWPVACGLGQLLR